MQSANAEAVAAGDNAIVDRLCLLLATSREDLIDRIMADRAKAQRVPDGPDPGYRPDRPLYEGDCPAGLRPYVGKDGLPVTLTDEQHHAIWRAHAIWSVVYLHEKGVYPDVSNVANLQKSCLLGRLLLEGKPPLPQAPPTADSAPWYRLIEDGRADLSGTLFCQVYGPYRAPDDPEVEMVNICGNRWTVRAATGDQYRLTHPNAGPGEWLLRHRSDTDPPVETGRRIVNRGAPDEQWESIYMGPSDWVLERQ